MYIRSTSGSYQRCMTCYAMKCWKKATMPNPALSISYTKLLIWLKKHPAIITGCSTWKAHIAASNTKPAAYKTQPLMCQSRTVVEGENVVHRTQTTCVYNAPKPEQKNVQVRDSSTKLSYRQKPLPWPPKREGNSMNITCYKCGQLGHIWTNCPHLTKVRTVAVRADGTEDPVMDPQEEELLPPNKEVEGEISEHQEE